MAGQLTILGSSVRAAAASAIAAGYQPYAIDLFADRDLAAACPAVKIERYPEDFLPALAAAPNSPWIYTGGLENYPQLVERLAALRPLLGNRGSGLLRIRDPDHLGAAAVAAGCHFPPWIDRPTAEQIRSLGGRGWLIKPRNSSGGKLVRWITSENPPALFPASYCQQYVAGQSASAVYVAAGGRAALLGATRQLLGSDLGLAWPFLYAGSIGPLALSPAEQERLQALGGELAERFDLCGLFNVDFVRSDQKLWVLEVNPRYSASVEVLESATATPFLGLHVAACEHRALPHATPPAKSHFFGRAIAYAVRSCRVGGPFDELVNDWNAAGQCIADLPANGQRFCAGEPVASVLATEPTEQAVEAALKSRVAEVLQALSTEC